MLHHCMFVLFCYLWLCKQDVLNSHDDSICWPFHTSVGDVDLILRAQGSWEGKIAHFNFLLSFYLIKLHMVFMMIRGQHHTQNVCFSHDFALQLKDLPTLFQTLQCCCCFLALFQLAIQIPPPPHPPFFSAGGGQAVSLLLSFSTFPHWWPLMSYTHCVPVSVTVTEH